MKEKEFPPITKNNIETWNDIVYSWLIYAMMHDKEHFKQPPKYGEIMTKADDLTELLFNALRKQMKVTRKCIYCKKALTKTRGRLYHAKCGIDNQVEIGMNKQ